MPVHVIGAGFCRTGTWSTKEALEMLGFGPCYHMIEVMQNGDSEHWLAVEDALQARSKGQSGAAASGGGGGGSGDAVADALKHILDGAASGKSYGSTCDMPANIYYKDLMQAYPDAKVLLTVRDDADKWWRSTRETVASDGHQLQLKVLAWERKPGMRQLPRMQRRLIWNNPRVFNRSVKNAEKAKAIYERWLEEVKAAVPAERLLVFNVKQGWEPLCEFLGVPVPEQPYPYVNETTGFKAWVRSDLRRMAKRYIGGTVLVAAGVAAAVIAHKRRR